MDIAIHEIELVHPRSRIAVSNLLTHIFLIAHRDYY